MARGVFPLPRWTLKIWNCETAEECFTLRGEVRFVHLSAFQFNRDEITNSCKVVTDKQVFFAKFSYYNYFGGLYSQLWQFFLSTHVQKVRNLSFEQVYLSRKNLGKFKCGLTKRIVRHQLYLITQSHSLQKYNPESREYKY